MMYPPFRRGRLQKLITNRDIVQSNRLGNALLREERKLDQTLQNLNTEERISLSQMENEIRLYRKMKNNIEKWEEDCSKSDISEAGSDTIYSDDDLSLFNNYCCDSNLQRKVMRDLREPTSIPKSAPSRDNSSFKRYPPLRTTRKVATAVGGMSKRFHYPLGKKDCRQTQPEPTQVENSFLKGFWESPQCFEEKKSENFNRPRSASHTQIQQEKYQNKMSDSNTRDRSFMVKQEGSRAGGSRYVGDQYSEFSHDRIRDHQACASSQAMRDDQHFIGLSSDSMGGNHQACGSPQDVGGHQSCIISRRVDGQQSSALSHHVIGHQGRDLSPQMRWHQADGTPRSIASNHSPIVPIRDLVHKNYHSGFVCGTGSHKPNELTRGICCPETGCLNRGLDYPCDSQIKASRTSNSALPKSRSFIPESQSKRCDLSRALMTDSPANGMLITYKKGTSPPPWSNTTPDTSDWEFQNTPSKQPGIILHNPMLFHPRFHNNMKLVPRDAESMDPNSFQSLRNCRYLRIPRPPYQDHRISHSF